MRFPDTPTFQGINAPSRIEVDLNDVEVEGEIPADLNGAFYRIAPDHQFPPRFADDDFTATLRALSAQSDTNRWFNCSREKLTGKSPSTLSSRSIAITPSGR